MRWISGFVLACGAITAPAMASDTPEAGLMSNTLSAALVVPGALPEPVAPAPETATETGGRTVIFPVAYAGERGARSGASAPDNLFSSDRDGLWSELIPTPGAGVLLLLGAMTLRGRGR